MKIVNDMTVLRRRAWRYVVCFAALIGLFAAAMTTAYCIPYEKIEYRQDASAYALRAEGEDLWFGNFFGVDASRLDNTTDSLMIDGVLIEDTSMSALEAAMSVNDYPRYWHGYMAVLRPLMVFFSYYQIRYINMFAFFLLLGAVFLQLYKRLGTLRAFSFLFSMIMCYIVVIPVSLQYVSVFLIMLCAMLAILIGYERISDMPLLFMAIGMITNFFDFLTVPVMTLGMPLLICLALDMKEQPSKLVRRWFFCSLAWGLGYALCWVSKWVIGSLVLSENVFASAAGKATQWTQDGWGGGRIQAVIKNFQYFFLAQGKKAFVPVFLLLIVWLAAALRYPARRRWMVCIYLPVCLYPYVWYLAMTNHSIFHTWFTNRSQAMTVFGLSLALYDLVDWQKLKQAVRIPDIMK